MKRKSKVLLFALAMLTPFSAYADTWKDVTGNVVRNAAFSKNTANGWSISSTAVNCIPGYQCMEFWNGTFDIHQELKNIPNGTYRVSYQGFYRCAGNTTALPLYNKKQEKLTAYAYAGDVKKPLKSVFSASQSKNFTNSYSPRTINLFGGTFYPNGLQGARHCFDQGLYRDSFTVEVTDGTLTIGFANPTAADDNWACFSNVRLEYLAQESDGGSIVINEVMASNIDMFVDPSYDYGGFIELYNPTSTDYPLDGLTLVDDKEQTETLTAAHGVIPANGCKVLWFDHKMNEFQTQIPYKLNSEGGTISLCKGSSVIATVAYPAATPRTSYARTTDGGDTWGTSYTPSPGRTNLCMQFAKAQTAAPEVDTKGGLINGSKLFTVTVPEGATLYYTTDGTTPTIENGKISLDGIFEAKGNCAFRFRAFEDGKIPSRVITRSFVKNDKDYLFPIISITTDPDNLYDDMMGCYVSGKNGSYGDPILNVIYTKANYFRDWTRPVNFEYYDAEGKMLVNQECGFQTFGGMSVTFEPRNFKLKANKIYYDDKAFLASLFPEKPYNKYKELLVRSGGQDLLAHCTDLVFQNIIRSGERHIDTQCGHPVYVFINGEFHAIMNLREPSNKNHGVANYGYDDDAMDAMEMTLNNMVAKEGSLDILDELYELSKNAANDAVYAELESKIDIDGMINYYVAETCLYPFLDWPHNNLKAYRSWEDGKLHFTLFDLDACFYSLGSTFSSLENARTYSFKDGSSVNKIINVFTNMMQNETFRRRVIDTYSLWIGSIFTPDNAERVTKEYYEKNSPGMLCKANSINLSTGLFGLRNRFTTLYQCNLYRDLKGWSRAGLKKSKDVDVVIKYDEAQGRVLVNGLEVPRGDFDGKLFTPATLSAVPAGGYKFAGWKTLDGKRSYPASDFVISADVKLCPVFEAMSDEEMAAFGMAPVVVNEVGAENDVFMNELMKKNDWIELYNVTDEAIDVAGCYLTDNAKKPEKFKIPSSDKINTVIPAHGHLVVWADKLEAETMVHTGFKLDNTDGSFVTITAADHSWSNTLTYTAQKVTSSVGRYPDGGKDVYAIEFPTIGKLNRLTYADSLVIFGESRAKKAIDALDTDTTDTDTAAGAEVKAIYNTQGAQIPSLQSGINIITYTDGTVRKVVVK